VSTTEVVNTSALSVFGFVACVPEIAECIPSGVAILCIERRDVKVAFLEFFSVFDFNCHFECFVLVKYFSPTSASMNIKKMKVAELRDELSKRGLDTKGTKPVLLKRLEEAILLEGGEADDAADGTYTFTFLHTVERQIQCAVAVRYHYKFTEDLG
jgi:hypothetical protein